MRRRFGAALALALVVALGGTAAEAYTRIGVSYRSYEPVSVSFFYDQLAPYGEWFRDPAYGWCWTPYDVPADWRPYEYGHWEYSDWGWVWVSDEPWGWAPYHYGRWFFDDDYGWAWVPGDEWAPAWVAWRWGDDCVGWAPLPPRARWSPSFGLSYVNEREIEPNEWCFVPRDRILDRNIHLRAFSVARNVTLLDRSRDVTRFEVRGGHPYVAGPDVHRLERTIGRPIDRVRIADADSPQRNGWQGGGMVRFFRPRIERGATHGPPASSIAERRPAMPEPALRRERDLRGRRLEDQLARERFQLNRDQQDEMRRGAGRAGDLRRQHEMEQRAFDRHANEQRQVLEQRLERRIEPPPYERPDFRGGPPQQREFRQPPQREFQPPQQREFRQPPQREFQPPPQREFRQPPQREFRQPPPQRQEFRQPPPQQFRGGPPPDRGQRGGPPDRGRRDDENKDHGRGHGR